MRATRAILGWSVRARLGEIACPTLVISGDRDYTTLEAKAAWLGELRHAELVAIADSGHATPLDQPARFNHELERFLGGRAARAVSAPGDTHSRLASDRSPPA
jgi:pimeloyl-ACP methyl ester carboxylesterase